MLTITLSLALLQRPNVPAALSAEPLVSTKHQMVVHGRRLTYTATAGRLPIIDNETGQVRAQVFVVAYTKDGGQPDRPLTFAWNGGPGSNAGLIQLGGLGPRRFTSAGTLVDNQETWLDRSDLVFVDPVGTGYSRVTQPEYAADFYQTRGDAESVAELIRVYRTRFARWNAPVFLAGESFGVVRAAGVAQVLERRRIPVRGVILIGLTAPLAAVPPQLRAALGTTGYAVAAWHHRRSTGGPYADAEAVVAAARRFALDTLAPALGRRDLSASDRDQLRRAMAVHIGAMPSVADTGSLVLPYARFARLLLADRGLRLGHYDSRLTGPMDRADLPYDPANDPSLQGPPPPNGVVRYLRDELGYRSDLQYTGPFGGTYPPPPSFRGDWMSVRWRWERGEQVDSSTVADTDLPLRQALTANASLRVFVACGYYDLICTPATNDWVRDQLPADLRERVAVAGFGGGHALYLDDDARAQLKTAVFRFFGVER